MLKLPHLGQYPQAWAQKFTLSSDLGLSWRSAGGWFSQVMAGGDSVDPAPTCRLTPWFYWALPHHLVFSGPDPGPQIEFQAWLQTYFFSVLPIWTGGWSWMPFMSQICSLAAPCESLLFPPLIPEGATGLVAQAYFICQCEFRYSVPVLLSHQHPSSSCCSEQFLKETFSKEGPLGSSSLSAIKPLRDTNVSRFCASSNLGKVSKLLSVS